MGATSDKVFAGSIPEFSERFLVPLIFEPYALDLWHQEIAAYLPRDAAGSSLVKTTCFGKLYQKIVITV